MNRDLSDFRVNYDLKKLLETDCPSNPFELFTQWFQDAEQSTDVLEPNAMTLATANKQGIPSARIVLLKSYDNKGFVFFTNYNSKKALELFENPHASLVFLWKALHRQVRIKGSVEKLDRQHSEEYFKSRPRNSQIGAWVSQQSQILKNRDDLETTFEEFANDYEDREIPLPDFWGGFLLRPECIEFWQGRESRLHDRIEYNIQGGSWNLQRLYP
jgi:pyridoxamine 5'-phosphate oxidase